MRGTWGEGVRRRGHARSRGARVAALSGAANRGHTVRGARASAPVCAPHSPGRAPCLRPSFGPLPAWVPRHGDGSEGRRLEDGCDPRGTGRGKGKSRGWGGGGGQRQRRGRARLAEALKSPGVLATGQACLEGDRRRGPVSLVIGGASSDRGLRKLGALACCPRAQGQLWPARSAVARTAPDSVSSGGYILQRQADAGGQRTPLAREISF